MDNTLRHSKTFKRPPKPKLNQIGKPPSTSKLHSSPKTQQQSEKELNLAMKRSKTQFSQQLLHKSDIKTDNIDFISKSKMKIYDKRLLKANDQIQDLISNMLNDYSFDYLEEQGNNIVNAKIIPETGKFSESKRKTVDFKLRQHFPYSQNNHIPLIPIDNNEFGDEKSQSVSRKSLHFKQASSSELKNRTYKGIQLHMSPPEKNINSPFAICQVNKLVLHNDNFSSNKHQTDSCFRKPIKRIPLAIPSPLVNSSLIAEHQSIQSLHSYLSSNNEEHQTVQCLNPNKDPDKETKLVKESRKIINLVSLNEPLTSKRTSNNHDKDTSRALPLLNEPKDNKVSPPFINQAKTKASNPLKLNQFSKKKAKRELMSFRNVYDSFSDEEIDFEELIPTQFVLLPYNMILILWNLTSALFVIYSIIISPFTLAFNINNSIFNWIDIISDVIFLIEVFINFFVAYFDEDFDILIVSIKRIAIHYLSTYFALDLIASMPLSLISSLFTVSIAKGLYLFQKITRLSKFCQILSWFKISRLIKLTTLKFNTNETSIHLTTPKGFRVFQFVLFLLAFMHITACMWVFIGQSNVFHLNADNWISRYKLADEINAELYITSLYFLFGTILSAGYGDITGTSTAEREFLIIFMLFGCLIFSFILTSLSAFFSNMDMKTIHFSHKQILLEQIRVEYKLSSTLYEKLKKTIKHEYSKWKEDQLTLLQSLPGSLSNNLYMKMHENQIKHLHFFKNQSYDFILFAVPLFKSVHFSKDDVVISFGDLIEEMYLIIKGMLSLHLGYKYNNYEIGVLRYGEHFGDIIMYLNDQSHYEIKVKTKVSEVFCLSKTNFANLKLNFRYAIDDILKQSYLIFTKIETKRKLAIEHFNLNGNLNHFREYYYNHCKTIQEEEDDDAMWKDDNSTSINLNSSYNSFATNNHILPSKPDANTNQLKIIQNQINRKIQDNADNKKANDSLSLNDYNSPRKQQNTNSPKRRSILSNFLSTPYSPIRSKKLDDSPTKKSLKDNGSSVVNESFNRNSTQKTPIVVIGNVNINYANQMYGSPRSRTNQGRRSSLISVEKNYRRGLSPNFRRDNNKLKLSPRKDIRANQTKKESFLNQLNEKIEKEAVFQQNSVLLKDYLVDFIDDKKNEDEIQKMIRKLNRIETELLKYSSKSI